MTLDFQRRDDATILTRREHVGPLRVQKSLYPEGKDICHVIVLHPPSGIAGGDELNLTVKVGTGAQALLTTPGAGKWYRSAGPWAKQQSDFTVGANATLEWLPQENIVFDAARADIQSRIELDPAARFIGMEILCLGRRASGESFGQGMLKLQTRVQRDGQPLWLERGWIEGGSGLQASAAGLAGYSVNGTLMATAPHIEPGLLTACRAVPLLENGAQCGITLLPDLLVARYLGHMSEAARHWFFALWQLLRPVLIGRDAQMPRIWNT